MAAVRLSCQTTARATGLDVARSHATTVSRWFVMPTARKLRASTPAALSASADAPRLTRHSSSGSCSTQPGRG
jgi:hypothetical protein